ncbi:MAG: hypothetical protein AAGC60_15330 [Acidobacteriota bacterium]
MSQTRLTIDAAKLEPQADLDAVRNKALIVGGIGAAATVGGFFLVPADVFYRAYLVGWVYWIGFAVGLFMLNMLTHLSGGRWGRQMKRIQEAAGRSLWLFALLALPFLIGGMQELFPWARPEAVDDALVQLKRDYLKLWFDADGNGTLDFPREAAPGFYPRQILYFALFLFWAFKLSSLSRKHDETGEERYFVAQQRWSAGGIIVFVMVATFASIDWLMSTDPHWFSSLYGAQMLDWWALSALGVSIPLLVFFGKRKPLDRFVLPKHFHDHGKLLLAFTMVWGYFSVSQFLIIWSGDLPEEVVWYLYRNTHGWKLYTVLLVLFTFFVPFLVLLWQKIKFQPKRLMYVAFFILATRWFDYYWQVAPNLHHDGVSLHWFDFVPPIAMGGLWVALLFHDLRGKPVMPVHDPVVEEAIAEGDLATGEAFAHG